MNDTRIYQANAITSSRHDFSPTEKNVVYRIVQKLRNEYDRGAIGENNWKDLVVRINSADFAKIADENHTKRAKDALRKLRHRDFEIEDAEGNWLNVGFINYAEYMSSSKTYEVEVSRKIMPYFLGLVKNFTALSATVAMSLRSKYSKRFYEFCCQYKQKGGFYFSLTKLREMLKAENLYKNIKDFRKCVIDTAKNELQEAWEKGNSDCYFTYSQNRKGDDITFYFSVFSRENQQGRKEVEKEEEYMQCSIFSAANKIFPNDTKFRERIMWGVKAKPSVVRPLFLRLHELQRQYKGDDLARLLRHILREDFGIK